MAMRHTGIRVQIFLVWRGRGGVAGAVLFLADGSRISCEAPRGDAHPGSLLQRSSPPLLQRPSRRADVGRVTPDFAGARFLIDLVHESVRYVPAADEPKRMDSLV